MLKKTLLVSALAAIALGKCTQGQIITVKLKGGDLFVRLNDDGTVELDGSVRESFRGIIEI